MTAHDFGYWLRGVLEVAEPSCLNAKQIDIINKHLDLVMTPVTKVHAPPPAQVAQVVREPFAAKWPDAATQKRLQEMQDMLTRGAGIVGRADTAVYC